MLGRGSAVIAYGDTVVLWANKDSMTALRIEQGKVHNCKFGRFAHEDLIGHPYGAKVCCRVCFICTF